MSIQDNWNKIIPVFVIKRDLSDTDQNTHNDGNNVDWISCKDSGLYQWLLNCYWY